MTINLYAVPLLVGFIVAWISAFLMFIRGIKTRRYSDLIFSFLLIATSFILIEYMFGYMGINILWQELLFFPYETSLLIGPLFFLYFKSQINTDFRINGKDWFHFAPYILYVLYHLIIYYQGRDFVVSYNENSGIIGYLDMIASFVSNIFYFGLTLKIYRDYKKWLPNEMPEGTNYSFQWFSLVIIAMLLSLIVIWTFTFINLAGFPLDYQHNVWQYILLSLILVILSFEGYAQKQPLYLDYRINSVDEVNKQDESASGNEKTSNDLQLKMTILGLMEEEKLYLNPDITLKIVSTVSGYSKTEVSQCINSVFDKNFSQFINEYRIKAVCEALEAGEHNRFSLLGIAMNAGFNSKATFNRVFKEYKKCTPKQYAQKLNN